MSVARFGSLLYIEPQRPAKMNQVMADRYSFLKDMMNRARRGIYNKSNGSFGAGCSYNGIHFCKCGARSNNYDLLLDCGLVTNSLAYHYIEFHWDEINANERAKLETLHLRNMMATSDRVN